MDKCAIDSRAALNGMDFLEWQEEEAAYRKGGGGFSRCHAAAIDI